ncbi:MAG: glutamate synthase, partial [Actinophytocola sp.]
MTGRVRAENFPEAEVRRRAGAGRAGAFPEPGGYGRSLFGAADPRCVADPLDALRLVPPVFMPRRLEKLIGLGREPGYPDVESDTSIGGFSSPLPLYLSAFGSTRVASTDLGVAASRQAARLGLPMVVGENVVPVNGYGRLAPAGESLLARISAYADEVP